jgi:predicted Zn-dependent protease
VADLMVYAYWTAAARTAHEGQSVYARPGGGTRIGERLSSRPVQLYSDPAHPGLEAIPFVVAAVSDQTSSPFDTGLPLRRTDWVRDGELAALVQTRRTADLTGQPVTPAVDNLVMSVDGGSGDTDDLVAGVDRGLLATCLWYIREVDPQTLLLTGLTRDGVYVVEGGEITGAANNFRFNESPISVLDRIAAASGTAPGFSREWGDYFPRTAMPAVRVPDFHMSTVSRAT